MRTSARSPSEDIATASLWSVLMRSWLRVLIVAGFAGAAAFTALALVPARYAVTTEIRIPTPASADARAATIAALQAEEMLELRRDMNAVGAHIPIPHHVAGAGDRERAAFEIGAKSVS